MPRNDVHHIVQMQRRNVMRAATKIRELGNKKVCDPRSYLALAKTAMAERVKQAASDLRATGKPGFAS